MAQGKRILITSRSSDALNVIKEKITGTHSSPSGVFERGDDLQGLIFAWGDQKQAFQRFSAASQVLHDLKTGNTDLEADRVDTRRKKEKINKIDEHFSGTSQIACVRLNQIASQTSGKDPGLAAVAKAIEQMCKLEVLQMFEISETMEDTPYKLAVRIQKEMDKTDAFQSFADCVEEDLNRTLEDEGKRQQLLTWFKSESASNLRADLENQRQSWCRRMTRVVQHPRGGVCIKEWWASW